MTNTKIKNQASGFISICVFSFEISSEVKNLIHSLLSEGVLVVTAKESLTLTERLEVFILVIFNE